MVNDLIPWRRRKNRRSDVPAARNESDPFLSLRREIDEVFEDFLSGLGEAGGWLGGPRSHRDRAALGNRVDVSETDKEVRVTADLPGLDEKDLEVTLEEDTLILSGERRSEEESKDRNYRMVERFVGSFRRVIPLPSGLDHEQVKARFKKGVLTVTIPRTEQARAARRTIAIEAE